MRRSLVDYVSGNPFTKLILEFVSISLSESQRTLIAFFTVNSFNKVATRCSSRPIATIIHMSVQRTIIMHQRVSLVMCF